MRSNSVGGVTGLVSLKALLAITSVLSLVVFVFAFPGSRVTALLRFLVTFSYFWCLMAGGFAGRKWRPALLLYGGMGTMMCVLAGPLFQDSIYLTRSFSDWGYFQVETADFLMDRLGYDSMYRSNPGAARVLRIHLGLSVQMVGQLLISLAAAWNSRWIVPIETAV